MFDILFNSKKAVRRPVEMMFIAIFYSSISILVASWIFAEYTSLISVFFTVISCLYVTQGAIKIEASKENQYGEGRLLREHMKPLKMFIFLFIGIVISFSFWTYALPAEKTIEMFNVQASVLEGIRGSITGDAISDSQVFGIIMLNNIKVLFVSLVVSLIYGAGAIFVLTWNASIMGYVIGSIASDYGAISFPAAFAKYFLHGIPEMLSYFIAILAGGIIYVALFRGDFKKSETSKKIILDIFVLIGIAIVFMVLAAFLEVFVSPLI